jgi:hypothetical protein
MPLGLCRHHRALRRRKQGLRLCEAQAEASRPEFATVDAGDLVL